MYSRVYLIADGKLTKIGVSKHPSKRLKQVCKNGRIIITCWLPFAAFKIEHYLHKKFQSRRVKRTGDGGTEWFALTTLQKGYTIVLLWLLHNLVMGVCIAIATAIGFIALNMS